MNLAKGRHIGNEGEMGMWVRERGGITRHLGKEGSPPLQPLPVTRVYRITTVGLDGEDEEVGSAVFLQCSCNRFSPSGYLTPLSMNVSLEL